MRGRSKVSGRARSNMLRRTIQGACAICMAFIVTILAILLRVMLYSSPGERYLLAENFAGCITIVYGVPGAEPLPIEDGQYLVECTRPGEKILTSSPARRGQAHRTEFYERRGAERRAINPRFTSRISVGLAGNVSEQSCFNANEGR